MRISSTVTGGGLSRLSLNITMPLPRPTRFGGEIEGAISSVEDGSFEPEYPEESSVKVEEEMESVVDTTLSFEEQMERYESNKLAEAMKRVGV